MTWPCQSLHCIPSSVFLLDIEPLYGHPKHQVLLRNSRYLWYPLNKQRGHGNLLPNETPVNVTTQVLLHCLVCTCLSHHHVAVRQRASHCNMQPCVHATSPMASCCVNAQLKETLVSQSGQDFHSSLRTTSHNVSYAVNMRCMRVARK